MDYLEIRVLDCVERKLRRYLLGDHDPLSVSAYLRQDVGEDLDCPAARVSDISGLLGGCVAQQAMCLFNQRDVVELAILPLRTTLAYLIKANEDESDQERLLIVADQVA